MKTQTRITLLLTGVALLFISGFILLRSHEQSREELIVKSTIYEKNTLFDRVLRLESASLELFAYDFSSRDDILGIAGSPSENPASTLLERSLPSFNVSAVWLYDASLRLIYSANPLGITGVEQLVRHGSIMRELFSRSFFTHFFMDTPAGLVEFRSAPLQPSEDTLRTTPARGYLFAARLWSPAYLRDLEVVTECSLSVDPLSEQDTLESSSYDPRTGTVQFLRVVYGWDKKPLRQIKVRSQILLAREMKQAAQRQLVLSVLFAAAIIALLSGLLIVWVNVPLRRISASLSAEDPAFLKNLPRASSEFGNLAQLILRFFRQRDELRQEILERSRAQHALAVALEESRRSEAETAALLAAARAVLEHHDFADAAQSILALAMQLSGARAGFVAERDPQEQVLHLLASSLPGAAEKPRTMPVQGIYAEACASGKPCFRNTPFNALPLHHALVENIICVPLLLQHTVSALLVLANKPGGFSESDGKMAIAFSELAAVALLNSKTRSQLEASEERFRSVVATAGDAIITVTSDDRIMFWNQGAERMFGYAAAEVINQPATMLLPERLRDQYERQARSDQQRADFFTREMIGRRRDGSEFPMELSRSSWKTKEGTFYTAIIRDITERKLAEQNLRETEQRLRMQDKMASLGRVAAGIAHEIRNPLTGITTYVYMLQRYAERHDLQAEERQKLQEIIAALQTAADRIEAVIRRVMDFSRPSAPKLVPIDLNTAVRTALELAAVTLRKSGVALQTDLAPALPWCRADRSLIEQAVLNLLTNAAQALQGWQGSKSVLVQTRSTDSVVAIVVADSGPGIAPENRTKIFDPFFTTKSDGSGIGLSLCHRIVTDHQGVLSVGTSTLGGAEFKIELPVYHEQGAPQPTSTSSTAH